MTAGGPELRTERLRLRRWTDLDRPAFHALNCDPAVMAMIGADSTVRMSAHTMSNTRLTAVRRLPWLKPSPKINQLAFR